MQFDFKKYITEKYLTERLQSDILIHELLNDKDGMFTYYKLPYPGTIYKKALTCYNLLKRWITSAFVTWDNTFKSGGFSIGITNIDTDEKVKKFHKIYMDKVEEYKDLTSKLFIKPDPQILSSLISGVSKYNTGKFELARRDIYNITDEFFTRYTWQQLKTDKQLYSDVQNKINNCLAFWMRDGRILCVSRANQIILYNITLNNSYVTELNGKRFSGNMTKETIEDAVRKDNLIVNTLKCTLSDGTELEWPTVSRQSYVGDRQDLCGIDFVKEFLDINKCIYYKSLKFYQVGKFISHSSSLAKATSWGDKEDDYVIIYEPDGFYKDEKGNIKSTYIYNGERVTYSKDNTDSYNDMKSNMAFSDRKKNRRVEYEKKENSVYKWVKDLFGTYQPYANGKNSKMFEFGLKLSEYDYDSLYGDDGYCNKIALQNIKRYKLIISQCHAITGISEFADKLNVISQEIKSFGIEGKGLCIKLKTLLLTDNEKYKELTFLYGTYMAMLNQMLSKFGKVHASFSLFKKQYQTIKKSDKSNEFTHKEIDRDRERIQKALEDLQVNCEEMIKLKDKIKTTMSE